MGSSPIRPVDTLKSFVSRQHTALFGTKVLDLKTHEQAPVPRRIQYRLTRKRQPTGVITFASMRASGSALWTTVHGSGSGDLQPYRHDAAGSHSCHDFKKADVIGDSRPILQRFGRMPAPKGNYVSMLVNSCAAWPLARDAGE